MRQFLPRQLRALPYLLGGRIPWSRGYSAYREVQLRAVVSDPRIIRCFREGGVLPPHYGRGLDERIVEYPWVLARLSESPGWLLDAGSALNHDFILEHSHVANKRIVIYTLAPESRVLQTRPNVSHIYGDLRHLVLRDRLFDEIACISTLEHIGKDNARFYVDDPAYRETHEADFKVALEELKRVLASRGRILLTMPFGRHREFGWFQMFDAAMVRDVIDTFRGELREERYFRYAGGGWQVAGQDECLDCTYNDLHTGFVFRTGSAACAEAVVCLDLSA